MRDLMEAAAATGNTTRVHAVMTRDEPVSAGTSRRAGRTSYRGRVFHLMPIVGLRPRRHRHGE